jgi:hypothetical protein
MVKDGFAEEHLQHLLRLQHRLTETKKTIERGAMAYVTSRCLLDKIEGDSWAQQPQSEWSAS